MPWATFLAGLDHVFCLTVSFGNKKLDLINSQDELGHVYLITSSTLNKESTRQKVQSFSFWLFHNLMTQQQLHFFWTYSVVFCELPGIPKQGMDVDPFSWRCQSIIMEEFFLAEEDSSVGRSSSGFISSCKLEKRNKC